MTKAEASAGEELPRDVVNFLAAVDRNNGKALGAAGSSGRDT